MTETMPEYLYFLGVTTAEDPDDVTRMALTKRELNSILEALQDFIEKKETVLENLVGLQAVASKQYTDAMNAFRQLGGNERWLAQTKEGRALEKAAEKATEEVDLEYERHVHPNTPCKPDCNHCKMGAVKPFPYREEKEVKNG